MPATICQPLPNAAPDAIAEQLHSEPGFIYLRSSPRALDQGRYSFLTCRPFLRAKTFGTRLQLTASGRTIHQFGNPWPLLASLISRYEVKDQIDSPFPLGGCFGFWGYDLKNFLEPQLPRNAHRDLDLPDCAVGFYDSLLAFDHYLGKTWAISTGLTPDGSRSPKHARQQLDFWRKIIENPAPPQLDHPIPIGHAPPLPQQSSFTRDAFLRAVQKALAYIRAGDIYQVNLSQRLAAPLPSSPWRFSKTLAEVSPAPFSSYYNAGGFQLASTSPELFLRINGQEIVTRPIKGTRPRSSDPTRDAQLSYELQTSPKELAELVMITDLLRNDLGKICEYGSVQVPELVRLERFAHVQHLISTVHGRLRPDCSHLDALAAVFPGGSITGAPKIRAMEIIDELEPTTRGPYTGCLGYIGFNRESQLSILIRTAILHHDRAYFPVGAGIVADSQPEAEFDETLDKAAGFFHALRSAPHRTHVPKNFA